MTMTFEQVETRPATTDWDLIQRLSNLYETGKSGRGQLTEEWKRHYRLCMNRTTAAVPTATGVRANEVFPAIDARIGWMTDQEISCSITPSANPFDPYSMIAEAQASHLEAVINSLYYATHWYAEVVKMLWDAALYGAGFLKVGWDAGLLPGMGPEGEPLGNVVLKNTSPWCLYIDPYATSLDDANWLCEVHTMTPAEIERRFPNASDRLVEEANATSDTTSDHVPPSSRTSLQKEGAQLIPINAGQGPTTWGAPGGARTHRSSSAQGRNVYEMWWKQNVRETKVPTDPAQGDKPRPVVTDQWRVTVWSGTVVLLDELAENLLSYNGHVFVRYVDSETGELYGSALMRDLAPCQIAMNRLLAMAQNNTEYTGNPVLVGVKGSGVDRSTWLNRPGQIYDVNGGPTGGTNNRPDWLSPPNLPTQLMDLIMLWREEIERICGLQQPQRGTSNPNRTSDKQVAAAAEAGFVRVRGSQRNLEITLGRAFSLAAQLAITNYDVARTVAVVGPEGEQPCLQLAARHFLTPSRNGSQPLKFTLLVNGGASKPTSRAARFAEALQLKSVNAVDNQYLLEAARVSHIPQVLARVAAEQQAAAQLKAQQHTEKGQTHPK